MGNENKENATNNLTLHPKSRSPKQSPSKRLPAAVDAACTASSGTNSQCTSNVGVQVDQAIPEGADLVSPRFVSQCLMLALVMFPLDSFFVSAFRN